MYVKVYTYEKTKKKNKNDSSVNNLNKIQMFIFVQLCCQNKKLVNCTKVTFAKRLFRFLFPFFFLFSCDSLFIFFTCVKNVTQCQHLLNLQVHKAYTQHIQRNMSINSYFVLTQCEESSFSLTFFSLSLHLLSSSSFSIGHRVSLLRLLPSSGKSMRQIQFL